MFIPLVLGLKGGSIEGMVLTALGIQAIYFTSLITFNFPPIMNGFMQFLRISRLELDSIPNIFLEYIMNEGSRTELLIRTNDMNFFKIANMIEFNSLKLILLFLFNFIFFSFLISLLICKKRRLKIKKKLEFLVYKGFLVIFFIMFAPFGFSCFGEVENIGKTSPYKIVSSTSTFLFIFIVHLRYVSLL